MMQEKWGKLSDIGFPKLLHTIFVAGNSASVLDMEDRKIKKRLFFKTGIPVYGISNILQEVLGRFMVQKGIITQEVYEKSLKMMLNEKKKQGEVLLLKGRVTPHQLNDALNIQAKERLFSAFGWTNGIYHYYTIEKLPKGLFLYPTHPAHAILYAIRMGYYPIDKVKTAMEENRNKIFIFSPAAAYTLDDFQPTLQERRVFTLLNGRKKIDDILAEMETKFSTPKQDMYPFIYTLITTDVITAKQEERKKTSGGASSHDNTLLENLTGRYLRLQSMNYFEVLGLGQDADKGKIKKAYFKMAKEYHPDRYHNNTHEVRAIASDIFTLINTAYTKLSDEKMRRAYRESLKSAGKQDIIRDAANIMDAELQFQRGKIALSNKDYKSAKEAFDYTLKLNPDEGEYKSYLGWAIFNLWPKDAVKVKIARKLIQEGISSNPKQDRAYYFLGVIYRLEGKIDEAEAAFHTAIKKNQNIPEALNELRLIQMRKQRGGKIFQTSIY